MYSAARDVAVEQERQSFLKLACDGELEQLLAVNDDRDAISVDEAMTRQIK